METIFAYFDGDNVGNRLELLLLDGRVADACAYSESLNQALRDALALLQGLSNVNVLVAGGDDLLASWLSGTVSRGDLEKIRQAFFDACGQSMSVGVGRSASGAVHCLRRAKLMGKAQIICEPGVCDAA